MTTRSTPGPPRLGVDLGTTRTVVAVADRGNYPVVGFISDAGDVIEHVPSVVAERGGELRFGFEAVAVAGQPGWSALRSFKRLLADGDTTPDREVPIGSLRLPLAELITRFLSALRRELLERSTVARLLRRGPIPSVAVATPANAHGAQRLVTLDGFREAGFEVAAMLTEPSAAALEYAHRFRDTLTARREHVVVYDLGGGTFDASLVRMTGRHHEVLATGGVGRLGGDDFDAVLADLVLEAAGVDPAALAGPAGAELLERCRQAKEALGPQARRAAVELDGVAGLPSGTVAVPVSRFYEAARPLVERSLEVLWPVLAPLARSAPPGDPAALRELAGLYVVGGGSALPLVGRVLRERLGRLVRRSPYPFAATAIGLAIAGDPSAGFQVVDRLARHVGVFREGEEGRTVVFDAVLGPDTTVTPAGSPLRVHRRYRAIHNVGHFRFAECRDLAAARGGDVVPLGEARFPMDPALQRSDVDLTRVPVRRLPTAGALVEEEYRLDPTGLVEVAITDLDTGYRRAFRLGR